MEDFPFIFVPKEGALWKGKALRSFFFFLLRQEIL